MAAGGGGGGGSAKVRRVRQNHQVRVVLTRLAKLSLLKGSVSEGVFLHDLVHAGEVALIWSWKTIQKPDSEWF